MTSADQNLPIASEFEAQMALARKIMAARQSVLRELAKKAGDPGRDP